MTDKKSALPNLAYLEPEFYLAHFELDVEMLGTVPKSESVHRDYVQAKAIEAAKKAGQEIPQELIDEELKTAIDPDEAEKSAWTGFHTDVDDRDRVFILDYMIRGFVKAAMKGLRRNPKSYAYKLRAYKEVVTQTAFVYPRHIYFYLPEGVGLGVNSRPLRAETAQGPRVALASSDTAPKGTRFDVLFKLLAPTAFGKKELLEALQYGASQGLGQWRGASHGRFIVPEYAKLSLEEALKTGMIKEYQI